MKKIVIIVKWLLIVWGGLCLIGALVIGGFFVYELGPVIAAEINSASVDDVQFILNWCNLGDGRIEKVVKSHVSAGPLFTGDHLDAYAIKMTHVSIEELTASTDPRTHGTGRHHFLKVLMMLLLLWAVVGSDEIGWFPKEEELRSSEVYVFPWSIYFEEQDHLVLWPYENDVCR